MKTFTKAEIDAGRKWHDDEGHEQCSVIYEGIKYPYFVLPTDKCPAELPHAVQRMTGESPEDGTIFAVSADVRENVRRYPILHEIIEFTKIGIGEKGRCSQAARRELELLRKDTELTTEDISYYINMRRDFFRDLIAYVASIDSFTPEDIEEFRASLHVFEDELYLP